MRYFVQDVKDGVRVLVMDSSDGEETIIFSQLTKNDQEASELIKNLKFEHDNGLYE